MDKLDRDSVVDIKLKPPRPDVVVLAVPFIRQTTFFSSCGELNDFMLECRSIATSRGLTLTSIAFAEAYEYDQDEGEYIKVNGVHIYGKPDANLARAELSKALMEVRSEGKLAAALRELG